MDLIVDRILVLE